MSTTTNKMTVAGLRRRANIDEAKAMRIMADQPELADHMITSAKQEREDALKFMDFKGQTYLVVSAPAHLIEPIVMFRTNDNAHLRRWLTEWKRTHSKEEIADHRVLIKPEVPVHEQYAERWS